ncbi:MAG: UDP-glucose/GDP-mannose dehydrogenase family protein [Flavobacteriaceae bacterium]|nr:UDP-glucose/GDP-mannose dehydrogenase family protein [Flavobacteriaceae bacterium]
MITILGLGFVGLTTGLGFSKKGFKTYGIDINTERLDKLKNKEIPFYEPHLKDVLEETIGKTFILDAPFEEAIKDSETIFICVGTPAAEDGSADLTYLLSAIDQILAVDDKKFKVIITKSTVPPSTMSARVMPYVDEKYKGLNRNIGFASNPEFLREGYCWEDFIKPDRVVIGVEDEKSKEILDKIYKPFNAPIHYVTYNTAEFIKYLSNTLLSTLISYSNEMSIIASHIGNIDIPKSFRILHEDKRWSGNPAGMASYVYPGCGYGGYCLPKDTSALNSIAIANGVNTQVLDGNLRINDQIKEFVVHKIKEKVNKEDSIGILGLSFKPESDDVRLTPSKDVIEKLLQQGYNNISVYDPIANDSFKENYPHIKVTYKEDLKELLNAVENVVILTGWKEFKENKEMISEKEVFDFRYIY